MDGRKDSETIKIKGIKKEENKMLESYEKE